MNRFFKDFTQRKSDGNRSVVEQSDLFPFLNNGITLAFFGIDEKVSAFNDKLNIEVKAGVITSVESFNRRALILCKPMALLSFNFLIPQRQILL